MQRRGNESGFAMLMVFVLAALIAVTLYFELPRVMFERTREREQLLIDRGEQYSLAVRRYYMKFGRFPAKMDDLDNTNNMRFLRRHYKDPMTGEEDWRIIHESAGVLTDSLVHQAPQQTQGQNGAPQSFGTLTSSAPFGSTPGASSTDASTEQAAPMAWGLTSRPSDRGPLGTAHGGVSAGTGETDLPIYADNGAPPALSPSADVNPPSDQGAAQTADNQNGANAGGAANPAGGQNAGNPATPGNPAIPGNPANPRIPGNPIAGPGDVARGINDALRTARPIPNGGTSGGQQLAGGGIGIAGVASKSPFRGIKTYNDRTKYKEWEFVFDLSKLQQQQAAQQGGAQQGGNPLNQPGGTQPTQPNLPTQQH